MLSRYTLCIVLTFVVVTSQHHCVCCRCIWYVADAYEVVSFSSTRPVHGKVPLVFEPCNMQGPSWSQKHVLVLHSMHAHRCIAAGKQPVNPAGQLMKKCTRVPLESVCHRPSFIFSVTTSDSTAANHNHDTTCDAWCPSIQPANNTSSNHDLVLMHRPFQRHWRSQHLCPSCHLQCLPDWSWPLQHPCKIRQGRSKLSLIVETCTATNSKQCNVGCATYN